MYGLWSVCRSDQKRKSGLVYPRNEPENTTRLRREAFENGLNANSFLFLAPAVAQAAACDGSMITATARGQDIAPGTLPTY